MGRFEGRVAVVTGGTSGMGRAVSVSLARNGAAVVFGGRDKERGREVLEEIERIGGQARFVAGSVGDEAVNAGLVETAVREFGALHHLIPCAGILALGSITELSPERWLEAMATNLHSVYYLLHHGIPAIEKNGGGSIVVIGSIAAYKGFPNHAAYCASKGALVPLVKQVAVDYAPGIRANILCPGPVDTPLIWASAEAFPDPERAVADVAEKNPMKRLGLPADIADATLFLASDEARWITGSALTIDGGILCL